MEEKRDPNRLQEQNGLDKASKDSILSGEKSRNHKSANVTITTSNSEKNRAKEKKGTIETPKEISIKIGDAEPSAPSNEQASAKRRLTHSRSRSLDVTSEAIDRSSKPMGASVRAVLPPTPSPVAEENISKSNIGTDFSIEKETTEKKGDEEENKGITRFL